MRKSTTCLFILSVAIVVAALLSVGMVVSAQNANSSMTMGNSNTSKPKPRRGRRRTPKAATSEAATPPAADTTMAMPAPKKTGRCDPNMQEQTDLSGTYTGKMKHGNDPVADATLTVTGNNFTGTMGSQTVSGRIVAVTTCGYTAVTIMHEGQPHAMSLRAKRMGSGGLMLTSVPGEPEQIMFTTGGGAMRPRKHRTMKKTGAPPAPAKTTP